MSDQLRSPDGLPVRVNFLDGQVLTADELRADQDYHRRMRYLHNRLLHGWGIVNGLDIRDDGGGGLCVGPGVAIDSLGREMVLFEPAHIDLPPEAAVEEQTVWYVIATWEQIPSAPVAATWEQIPSAPVTGGDEVAFSRWIERCAISIRSTIPEDSGPALLLGAITAAAGNVAGVDTSRKRPLRIADAPNHSAARSTLHDDH